MNQQYNILLIINFLRMKKNKIMKYFSFLVYLVAFIACHDDHHTEPELPQGQWTESHSDNAAFDPNIPVQVSGINPTTGGFGQRLVISGENFGNDPSIVNVFVGGKKAIVINVKNHSIYCLVPSQAYS